MLAHTQSSQFNDMQHRIAGQVEGDFQLSQHNIIIDAFFCLRLRTFFLAPSVVYQTIEKNCQLGIAAILPSWIIIFFQPIANLLPGDVVICQFEDGDHLRIA